MGASAAPREASASRWTVVALPRAAALSCLRLPWGRTSAVRVPPWVVSRSSGAPQAAQLVSTKALGEVHSRLTTDSATPQVGQRATRGGGDLRGGGVSSPGWPGTSRRRMVASGTAQLAGSKPKWRTFINPSGQTWWRNRRSNSMPSRWAGAGPANLPGGEGDGPVLEAYEAAVGDGTPEDVGGAGGAGGMGMVLGLTVAVPRDGPPLGIAGLQPSGVAHLVFAERTGDRGEGFDGAKAGGAGRAPRGAVLREAPARNDVVDRGVVRQLPAPGVQAPGKPRQSGPEEALVVGQPLEGRGRRLQQGLGGGEGSGCRVAGSQGRCRS